MKKIGYLIPEFPSQTHIWIWREIIHMREWGTPITIFSTRHPDPVTKARHAFAQSAAKETVYLWPQNPIQLLSALGWAMFKHPQGFWRMLKLCFTLKLDARPVWRETLPLGLVAPFLAYTAMKHNIQHFHSHSCSRSAVLAMLVKQLVGIPFSLTLNANIEWWGGAMEQKFSDAEFTISTIDWLLTQIRTDYPKLARDKALLGRVGVDTTKWYPAQVQQKSSDSPFKILTVARLHFSKGHDTLIKSINLLLADQRKVELKLVGSGPDEDSLKALVQDLGLTDVVTFTGSLSEDQIIDLMRQSDVFALASHAEPLGVVYMEAMAMGVPTIGTNAGGVTEIITHQQDGLLVPPHDEIALKEAIACLMDDPQLRQQLSQQGRKTGTFQPRELSK
ncbi:MAG: glycosyltransferase family 4 protein [Oculatellaceae cyanobacterium Prado106]|nr:glycosyltransferase family 4 protein [Oculatellaceae cyanobacterium Prado106]